MMNERNDYLAYYHGVSPSNGVGSAWVLFHKNPMNGKLDEVDYGDKFHDEIIGAIGNTACFIAAIEFLNYFRENYDVCNSNLTLSGCNLIVANQISEKYKIGEGSYVEYARECLSIIDGLREIGCVVKSVYENKNAAKELAQLTKIN